MELDSIRFENVRNFEYATLQLSENKIVLVGRNNSGKTSALKILDWIFNDLDTVALANQYSDPLFEEILLPARNTGKKARRATLFLKILDGRKRKKYKCNAEHICQIRFKVYKYPFSIVAKFGPPKRGEDRKTDPIAIELINSLRASYTFTFIPSFRDASSNRFANSLDTAFQNTLSERALHSGKQGGAPYEYRRVKQIGDDLKIMADSLTAPVIAEITKRAPKGMLMNAQVHLNAGPEEIVKWLTTQLSIKLVTGEHDENSVDTTSVGSGLQSLLDVALHSSKKGDIKQKEILVLEEPEAFLHPSAQRIVAREILDLEDIDKTIITTHSPIIIEEAGFMPIQITVEQDFYPHNEKDELRQTINSSLLKGHGAEMIFASSVLFVEGEGDRLFYETLRRRITAKDTSGVLDRLFVVPVDGNKNFIPWIKLVKSFDHSTTDQPISWLVVADGDSSSEMRKFVKDVYGKVPRSVADSLDRCTQAFIAARGHGRDDASTITKWSQTTKNANKVLSDDKVPLILHIADLEFTSLHKVSASTLHELNNVAGTDYNNISEFMFGMGSKGVNGKKASDPRKAPWMRGLFAELIPKKEISLETKNILKQWMVGAMGSAKAKKLLKRDW